MSDDFLTMDEEAPKPSNGIFAIRGNLDGAEDGADYYELRQFIGLMIENEEFLLPIEVMNEIIMIRYMTYVPGSPQFVEGVINLRGRILPAINLRDMMRHKTMAPTSASRIIIANHEDDVVGLIVDGITYVVTLNPDQIEDTTLSKGHGAELLTGISKRGDVVNGILDIGKVVSEVASGMDADYEDAS